MWSLAELVWSRSCVGCGDPGTGCCRHCRARLWGDGPVTATPEPCPPTMPTTWAGTVYSDTAAQAITAWKDDDRPDLGMLLAPLLARAVRRAVSESPRWQAHLRHRPALAVPVPSRPAGTRHRGRFPVHDLVRTLLAPHHEMVRPLPALRVSSVVRDQAGLDREARTRNLAGAMRVSAAHRDQLRGAPVLVVDDVVTTGATLAEAARVLTRAGTGPVIAVAVAATQRHARSSGRSGPQGRMPFRDDQGPDKVL